ncbi:hypothetical protein KSP39_PZI017064 [Platanthera zijinensis]|uniref:Uncharacterized protein n=1 Tax=Platanthera zijinensis TaxID=2320716 RepID=A0AAP0B6G3_9ASPA
MMQRRQRGGSSRRLMMRRRQRRGSSPEKPPAPSLDTPEMRRHTVAGYERPAPSPDEMREIRPPPSRRRCADADGVGSGESPKRGRLELGEEFSARRFLRSEKTRS